MVFRPISILREKTLQNQKQSGQARSNGIILPDQILKHNLSRTAADTVHGAHPSHGINGLQFLCNGLSYRQLGNDRFQALAAYSLISPRQTYRCLLRIREL